MNRCIARSILFVMKVRNEKSKKIDKRLNIFINVIITISSVMKLHTGVNYIVDNVIIIILECVEITHILLVNVSEPPMIIKVLI